MRMWVCVLTHDFVNRSNELRSTESSSLSDDIIIIIIAAITWLSTYNFCDSCKQAIPNYITGIILPTFFFFFGVTLKFQIHCLIWDDPIGYIFYFMCICLSGKLKSLFFHSVERKKIHEKVHKQTQSFRVCQSMCERRNYFKHTHTEYENNNIAQTCVSHFVIDIWCQ